MNMINLCKLPLQTIKYESSSLINSIHKSNRLLAPMTSSRVGLITGKINGFINAYSKSFGTSLSNRAMFNIQDEEDFQEKVVKSDTPVVVDFHANWCGPCKLLGPRLEGIIGGKGDKVHLAKIDIDSVSDLALEYGVSAVPSVLAFKDGKVVDKFIGLQEETRITSFVDKLIGSE